MKHIMLPALCVGNIFFATAQSEWEVFDDTNTPMTNKTVRALAEDQNGVLWVGTDYGLFSYDGTTWERYTTDNSNINGNAIRCITIDAGNEVWIGTQDDGIGHYDGAIWETIDISNSGLPDNSVKAITFDLNGDLLAGTTGGFTWRNDTGWVVWNVFNSNFFTNNISSVVVDSRNKKFIGTINGGLHMIDSAYTTVEVSNSYNSNALDNTILTVALDSSENPYMATPAAGMALFYQTSWTIWGDFNSGIPSNSLSDLYIDTANHLFYMTSLDKGLIRWDGLNFKNWETANSGLPEDHTLCTLKDQNGIVWVGTNNSGLVRFELALSIDETVHQKWNVYPNPVAENGFIRLPDDADFKTLSLFSIDGKLLHQTQINGNQTLYQIPPHILAGSYMVRLESTQKHQVSKLIVRQ